MEINDPVEKIIAYALQHANILYVHNAPVPGTNNTLDFYIPVWDTYIECKRMYTDRIHDQIARVKNVIVIQGVDAAIAFQHMIGG